MEHQLSASIIASGAVAGGRAEEKRCFALSVIRLRRIDNRSTGWNGNNDVSIFN